MSRAPKAAARSIEYGRASFSLGAGESARVRVTLGSRAGRALRGRRKLPAYAMVTITGRPVDSQPSHAAPLTALRLGGRAGSRSRQLFTRGEPTGRAHIGPSRNSPAGGSVSDVAE